MSSGRVVCLLANSQKADRVGADLMKNLKSISNTQLKFIGSGGPLMEAEGMTTFYSTDEFHPKPFVPFRGTMAEEVNLWLWLKRNPITKTYTGPMHNVLKAFDSKDLVTRIMGYKPSVIMTLDHDMLSIKQHRKFVEAYRKSSLIKPKQVHMGRFIYRFNTDQLKNAIDHVMYTIPINPRNWSGFQFPSTFIGQSSFEQAYRFLLKRNGGDHLLTKDSVQMNIDHFYSETENYIELERKSFRKNFDISDTATVLFLSPGNKESEFKWSLPILNKTANDFISQYAEPYNTSAGSPPISEFVVAIPVNDQNSRQIDSLVRVAGWKSRVILLETEDQRRSAQAGSDYSIAYNGDVVFENLANQLPTIIIENMGKWEYYFVLAWNRFNNDLNIIADGDLFPEVIEGQAHPPKLVELLNTWHASPAQRFWPLQGYENILHKLLPVKVREMGMGTHHEYYSPDQLAAQTLWEFIQNAPERTFAEEENLFLSNLRG
jgi:lipid A disaccharide synthetase